MQAAPRHADPPRHRTVHAVAEALAGRTQLVAAGPAHQARAADARGRFAHHAVAFAHALHRLARPGDRPAELVTEHDRNVHFPGMRVPRLMHVRAAHRDCAHFQQYVVVFDLGNGNLAQLDCERLQRVLDYGGVGLHRLFDGKEYHLRLVSRALRARGTRGSAGPFEVPAGAVRRVKPSQVELAPPRTDLGIRLAKAPRAREPRAASREPRSVYIPPTSED